MCFVTILSSSLNAMLIADKHCSDVCCDEFPVPETDHKSKQVKEHSDTKILFAISMAKTRYLRHVKYQNLCMNNKVRSDKNAICLHFPTSAEYLQKI